MSELHHATHARCTAHRHSSLIVWFIDDETLGGEEHACDGCSILQSHACHLCRVDDTSLAEVLIFACASVVTEVTFTLAYLLYDYSASPPALATI